MQPKEDYQKFNPVLSSKKRKVNFEADIDNNDKNRLSHKNLVRTKPMDETDKKRYPALKLL